MKYLKYLSYIFRHKWFVFLECWKEGLIWRGIIHDWTKFSPDEFFPYVNHDFEKERDKTGYYKPTDTGDLAFDFAWLLHQKRNRHHWQWWILPEDEGGLKILEMDMKDRIEMVCDWYGAHRAQKTKGTPRDWYFKHKDKMQLGPETREWIENKLNVWQ